VRDVVRVHRREHACEDDEEEDCEGDEGDVVAAKAPPGQIPRAAPDDCHLVLFGGEKCCTVEREFGCRLSHFALGLQRV
jgi:hypothetical protein